MELDQYRAYTYGYAVILAISREKGIELIDIHKKPINKMKFKQFLDRLRQLNFCNDVMLVMDNLSVHKSGGIKERMRELGFSFTYTPVYSPRYNGIEEVIGIGKRELKKQRLELIMKGKEVPLR